MRKKNKQGGKARKTQQKQQETAKSADTQSDVLAAKETDLPGVIEDPYLKLPVGQSLSFMGSKQSSETGPEENMQFTTSGNKEQAEEEKEDTAPKVDTDEDLAADAMFQDVNTPEVKSVSIPAKTETSQDPSYAATLLGESEPSKEEATEKLVSHPPLDVDTTGDEMDVVEGDMAPAPSKTKTHPPLTPLVRHEDTYPTIAEDEENVDYYMPEKEYDHGATTPSQLPEDAGLDAIFKHISSPAPYTHQKHAVTDEKGVEGVQRAETPKAYLSPSPQQTVVKGLQVLEEDDRSHSYTAIAEDIIGSLQSRVSHFLSGAEIFDLSKSAAKIDFFFTSLPWQVRLFIPSIFLMAVKYTLLWYLCVGRFCYHAFCATIKLYLFLALLPIRCLEKTLEWSFQLSVYITVWFLNRVPGGHKIPTALNGHVEK